MRKTKKKYSRLLMLALMMIPIFIQAQTIDIKGTVVDETGIGLTGATIIVQGKTGGVSADVDGNFTIKAAIGEKLQISFIGYATQVVDVKDNKFLTIAMEPDSKALEEVVVVGYGQQKKASVVGAISVVSTKELKQSPTANVTNALAGKLPGLVTVQTTGEPGADNSDLYIRGISTFTGSQKPLILVDGIERDFKYMSVQEIESISILKDASATAVYGVRGANGVVLVTTKRGQEGKPHVTLNADFGFQSPTRMFDMVNSYEMAVLSNEYHVNNGNNPIFSQEELNAYRYGTDPYHYPNINWADELIKNTAPQQQYNLTISGGNQTAKYFVMVGMLNQRGLYKFENYNADFNTNISYQKYNFRTNADFKISPFLSAKVNLAGVLGMKHQPKESAETVFDRIRVANPNRAPIKNPDGTWSTREKTSFNPVAEILDGGYSDQKETAITATVGMKADFSKILKGLSANIDFSFDFNNTFEQRRTRSNDFFQFNEDGTYTRLYEGSKLGYGWGLNVYETRYNFEPSISYANTFNDIHEITGLLLYNQSERLIKDDNSLKRLPYRRMGIVGRVTYGFKSKYFAEFNAGYNGSENFAPGNRFGFFPAGSVGYLISQEDFWKSDIVSYLKFRLSCGLVGNDAIGDVDRFLYMSLYKDAEGPRFGYPNAAGTSGLAELRMGNENLTWEKSTKYNFGIDAKFFKDQLSFTVDAFYEYRRDILTSLSTIPTIYGFSSIVTNDGEVSNRGFEVDGMWRGRIGKDFFYNVGGNMSFARNKIEKIPESPQKYDYKYSQGNRIGQPYGRISLGLFQSEEEILRHADQQNPVSPGDIKYLDINGDGIIDDNDQYPIGHPQVPEIFFGGTLGFSWKGFDLAALFQGAANSSYNFLTGQNMPFWNENNTPLAVWMDRWTPENRDAKYPRMAESSNNRHTSSFWQIDNKYLRLKSLEVGYTIPERLTRKVGIDVFRVYANGVNLLTWDNIKVYDPENYVKGSGRAYPMMRVVNFGFNLSF